MQVPRVSELHRTQIMPGPLVKDQISHMYLILSHANVRKPQLSIAESNGKGEEEKEKSNGKKGKKATIPTRRPQTRTMRLEQASPNHEIK